MSDLVVPCARGPRRQGHAVHTLSLLGCTLDQEVALCAKEVRWTRHIIFGHYADEVKEETLVIAALGR